MAQLDIQEKRGINPVWWIIGIIIVALIVWWIIAAANGNDATVNENMGAVEPAPATTPAVTPTTQPGTVTDLAMLTSPSSPTDVIGRSVELSGVAVQSVVSDKAFWAGSDEAQRVFVVRGNQMAENTPPDGAVEAGQHLTIWGTVQAMPSDLSQQTSNWNLKSTDTQALQGQSLYVQADSVRIQ